MSVKPWNLVVEPRSYGIQSSVKAVGRPSHSSSAANESGHHAQLRFSPAVYIEKRFPITLVRHPAFSVFHETLAECLKLRSAEVIKLAFGN